MVDRNKVRALPKAREAWAKDDGMAGRRYPSLHRKSCRELGEMFVDKFREAIIASGLTPPEHIVAGRIHRFPGDGKRDSNRSAWCLLFEGLRGGIFGDWSTGFREVWQISTASPRDARYHRKQIQKAQCRYQEVRRLMQKAAAVSARRQWQNAEPALFHDYLRLKQILPCGVHQSGPYLLVPIYVDNEITSVQTIDPDGNKKFLKDGRIAGGYYPIAGGRDAIYLCEGFATGASLHMYTKQSVAVAFNAGNLVKVAQYLKRKHPKQTFVIAADNDQHTKGNPGLSKGREAASAIGADLIYPDFSDESFSGTDFNDYLTHGGEL